MMARALFLASAAVILLLLMLSNSADGYSAGSNTITNAGNRRLLQGDYCTYNKPVCPLPRVRNVTCRIGGTVNCECFFVGRCYPAYKGCYLMGETQRTFCGF